MANDQTYRKSGLESLPRLLGKVEANDCAALQILRGKVAKQNQKGKWKMTKTTRRKTRVTNAFEATPYKDPLGNPLTDRGTRPLSFEIGRVKLSETIEVQVITKSWQRQSIETRTNWSEPRFWNFTNTMRTWTSSAYLAFPIESRITITNLP